MAFACVVIFIGAVTFGYITANGATPKQNKNSTLGSTHSSGRDASPVVCVAVTSRRARDRSGLGRPRWGVASVTAGHGHRSESSLSRIALCSLCSLPIPHSSPSVSSIIQIDDDADTKIRDKISAINAYMGARKLPPDLQKRIRNHFEYTWKRKTVYDEKEILYALPTSLRTRVALFLNQDLIRSVAFLRDLGCDCLALLVTELRPFRVGAGYWIFKQNSLGREMNFVAEGIVEVLGKKNKQLTVLSRGAYFGGEWGQTRRKQTTLRCQRQRWPGQSRRL